LRSGASPQALATTVVGSNLYVAYNALNAVGIVSTGSNTEVGVIFLTTGGFTGKGPSVMISDNAGTKLVVGNTLSNNLSIIDLVSNAVVATVNGCLQPSAMARTPDAPYVYVACQGSNNVLVVNTNTGFTDFDLPVGTAPNSLAFDAANKRLIVTNGGSGSVTFINENFSLPFAQIHSMTTVPIGAAPVQAASLPDGSRVYVATNGNNVVVIDSSTLTVKTSIAVPGPGQQISASSDSGRVAVTTTRPDPLDGTKTISELSVIDTATEAAAFTPPHVLAGLPRVLLVY
jgi:YVTN family beta-propeller protein